MSFLSKPLNRPLSKASFRDRFSPSPATLCGLAALFWGWHTGLLFFAVPMALVLEARHLVKQRWHLSLKDLKEVNKLSGAILLLVLTVSLFNERSLFIYSFLQGLPAAFFPFAIAQTYGIGVSTLLKESVTRPDLLRRGIHRQHNPFNIHYGFFVLCILSASAADTGGTAFYVGMSVLIALLLWSVRPGRASIVLWALLFSLSVGLGFTAHMEIVQFQQRLEAQVMAMISGMVSGGPVNPNGTATSMGAIGRLKLSGKIAFRVAPDVTPAETSEPIQPSNSFPLLLREATYNNYQLASWQADNSLFYPVPPGEADGEWILGAASEQPTTITISTNLERGDGVLTLPQNTSRITQLPVEEMQQNQYGAVQVDATGNAAYQVQFASGSTDKTSRLSESLPTAIDLQVPKVDRTAVEQTLAALNITGKSEQEIVRAIAAYFQSFRYSLDLLRPDASVSPVTDFLLNTQMGHCEYFASATALLLRSAGIPARYAVGYSVHEFSSLEQQYIVRNRDAHAWTLFYLDGRWQTLDTTPPGWQALDRQNTSAFRSVADLFSFLRYQANLRIRQLGDLELREVLLIMLPLVGYLVWRSLQQFQGQRAGKSDHSAANGPIQLGLDSEFYKIETWLHEQNLQRSPAESLLQWRSRLQAHLPKSQYESMQEILALHYRYRFDPQPLNPQERQQLYQLCQQWLAQG